MRTYYNECPKCGATLDPGEKCECQDEKKIVQPPHVYRILRADGTIAELDFRKVS